MHGRLEGVARLLILLGVLSLCAGATGASSGDGSHLQRGLEEIERQNAGLCPAASVQEGFEAAIARLSDEVAHELSSDVSGPAAVESLNRFIFGHLAIRGSADLRDPCNLLASDVLERKRGYCVGIAALYLVLAEQLDLPVHAVATPSHVFLRYDDGTTRINIETLQSGAAISDEQYIREQRIPVASIRRDVFMRNLTVDEFLAQVHNNLGVVYSERKEFGKAAIEYEAALGLDHRLPAAWYNYGNDLLRQGDHRRAVRYFSKSLRLYPTDVWALNNRGLASLRMGKAKKARRDFQEALRIDPGFEQAKKNLARLPAL